LQGESGCRDAAIQCLDTLIVSWVPASLLDVNWHMFLSVGVIE
jgi:hypothetical protein